MIREEKGEMGVEKTGSEGKGTRGEGRAGRQGKGKNRTPKRHGQIKNERGAIRRRAREQANLGETEMQNNIKK